jgi:hypothetical protein
MTTTTLAAYFQRRTREDGSTYVTLAEDRPEWLYDAVRDAHDGELPNDWRYQICSAIVDALADGAEPEEIADSLVDVYTHDLLAWLSDNVGRADNVNEALEEYIADVDNGIDRIIAAGQYLCIERMVQVLADAIAEHAGDGEGS